MTSSTVAGVDWAGGGWFVVFFEDGAYQDCTVVSDFEKFWREKQDLDRILIDVPIGLPDEETLSKREKLDSTARSVTGFPSSVFPVPSRKAGELATEDDSSYEDVAQQNEETIDKGLSRQSYQLASAAGKVDAVLQEDEDAKETIIESYPEVCFRGLLGEQLTHSKMSAAGVGERLQALANELEDPGSVLETITGDLVGETDAVSVDDVLDALALAVVAGSQKDLQYLPAEWGSDSKGIPMRMAYSASEQLGIDESR